MQRAVPTGRGLSLWWLPPAGLSGRLQGLIDTLAGRLGRPSFPPHVTVEAGLSGPPEQLAARISGSPHALISPPLRPTGISTRSAWNRTLVMELAPDPPALEARTAACTALGRTVAPASFQPHLSLLYGPLADEARVRLAQGLRLDLPPFHPVALALVDTRGPVPEWWELQRWPLVGAA